MELFNVHFSYHLNRSGGSPLPNLERVRLQRHAPEAKVVECKLLPNCHQDHAVAVAPLIQTCA